MAERTSETIEQVRVRVLPDGRMDSENAAAYLGAALHTLDQWSYRKRGPRFVKVGGKRFYFKCDLDIFIRGEQPQPLKRTA